MPALVKIAAALPAVSFRWKTIFRERCEPRASLFGITEIRERERNIVIIGTDGDLTQRN